MKTKTKIIMWIIEKMRLDELKQIKQVVDIRFMYDKGLNKRTNYIG